MSLGLSHFFSHVDVSGFVISSVAPPVSLLIHSLVSIMAGPGVGPRLASLPPGFSRLIPFLGPLLLIFGHGLSSLIISRPGVSLPEWERSPAGTPSILGESLEWRIEYSNVGPTAAATGTSGGRERVRS